MALKKPFLKKPATKIELENKLLEAAQILKKLRESSILWQKHYGAFKPNMVYWENKADTFLLDNIIEVEDQPKKIID